jgi:hypothetical protein
LPRPPKIEKYTLAVGRDRCSGELVNAWI